MTGPMQRRPSRAAKDLSSARDTRSSPARRCQGAALQLAPLAEQNKILYISGPAAIDAVTGINDYTFRSGRQTYQDVKAATAFLKGAVGKNVVVLAQDIALAGNVAVVRSIFGDLSGQKVDSVLVPATAQDFTPYAQRLKQKNADLVFVAWAGMTGPAMWTALDQQGVFDSVTRSSPASPTG